MENVAREQFSPDVDGGQVHSKTRFGRVPEKLMHDTQITDGAVRLYAHMIWRYGANKDNHEGRKSMASTFDVSEATITRRASELEAKDWIVVVPRAKFGEGRQSNFYHIFLSQSECRKWRKENGITKPEADEVQQRKSRKGVGGKSSHKPKVNSSSRTVGNSSSFNNVNLSSQELDVLKDIDTSKDIDSFLQTIQKAMVYKIHPIEKLILCKPFTLDALAPMEIGWTTIIGDLLSDEKYREYTLIKEFPEPPSKVPQKVSPAITDLEKNEMAVLCYGSVDAWKDKRYAAAMMGALKRVKNLSPGATEVTLKKFGEDWNQNDFRGQKGQKPKPHQVADEWLVFKERVKTENSHAEQSETGKPRSEHAGASGKDGAQAGAVSQPATSPETEQRLREIRNRVGQRSVSDLLRPRVGDAERPFGRSELRSGVSVSDVQEESTGTAPDKPDSG